MKKLILSLFALFVLAGCATPHNNYDPLESVNRPVYAFNRGVDRVLLKPLARTWTDVAPDPVQKGVRNFYQNIVDLFAVPAALLQGKGTDAANSMARVVANTTIGIGGLIDVASKEFKIPRSEEDFGQVLGFWGVPSGPYLMLPLLGPTTARDIVDPAVQVVAGPSTWIDSDAASLAYTGMDAVDTRAQLLPLDKTLAEQYDKYAYIRDGYLQRRWFKVHDGNPPHALPMNGDDPLEEEGEDTESTAASGARQP